MISGLQQIHDLPVQEVPRNLSIVEYSSKNPHALALSFLEEYAVATRNTKHATCVDMVVAVLSDPMSSPHETRFRIGSTSALQRRLW